MWSFILLRLSGVEYLKETLWKFIKELIGIAYLFLEYLLRNCNLLPRRQKWSSRYPLLLGSKDLGLNV